MGIRSALIVASVIGYIGGARANVLDTIKPGHWYRVPHSHLLEVAPRPAPPGVVGPKAVVTAWSGGAFDTKRGRMLVWGGGHADYSGNEIYAFDINTLEWSRLTNPSTDVGGNPNSGLYPDGRPRSAHSYNTLQYVPDVDRFMVFSLPATYRTAGMSTKVFAFDFKTGQWTHDLQPVPLHWAGATIAAMTAYDAATGDVWYHGSADGPLYSYDPHTNKWTTHAGGSVYVRTYATAAIDPKTRQMVAVGGSKRHPQAFLWNLKNDGRATLLSGETTGDKYLEGTAAPGFVFDPDIGKFVGWSGGEDVFLLDPATWKWTRIAPAPGNTGNPGRSNRSGTYGRFRYIPSKKLFILVNGASQDVYFYRLPNLPRS